MRTRPTKRLVPRVLAIGGVLLIASACSNSDMSTPNSARPSSANIPAAGSVAVQTAPQLPARDATMPTDTVALIDLYEQGKTDVLK